MSGTNVGGITHVDVGDGSEGEDEENGPEGSSSSVDVGEELRRVAWKGKEERSVSLLGDARMEFDN